MFNLLDAVKKLQAFFYCNDGLSLLSAIADVNIPTYYSKIPQNASHRNSQHEVLSNNKNNKFFRSPATDAWIPFSAFGLSNVIRSRSFTNGNIHLTRQNAPTTFFLSSFPNAMCVFLPFLSIKFPHSKRKSLITQFFFLYLASSFFLLVYYLSAFNMHLAIDFLIGTIFLDVLLFTHVSLEFIKDFTLIMCRV